MRMGEILGLSWDCIDWKSGVVRIYRQLHQIKGGYEFGALKNDKPRTITVAPSVLEGFQTATRPPKAMAACRRFGMVKPG